MSRAATYVAVLLVAAPQAAQNPPDPPSEWEPGSKHVTVEVEEGRRAPSGLSGKVSAKRKAGP